MKRCRQCGRPLATENGSSEYVESIRDYSKIDMPKDGNCFYHAFIRGLYEAQVHPEGTDGQGWNPSSLTPAVLRDQVARVIEINQDMYNDVLIEWRDFHVIHRQQGLQGGNVGNPTPFQVAQRIRNTREWATSTVIHILSVLYNVTIVVYEEINGYYYAESFPSAWKKVPPRNPIARLTVLRTGNHFDLLVKRKPLVSQ